MFSEIARGCTTPLTGIEQVMSAFAEDSQEGSNLARENLDDKPVFDFGSPSSCLARPRGPREPRRAMVIDGNGRIFLVKHSYVDGWHLPGGGVETGEHFSRLLRANWPRRATSSLELRRSSTASISTNASSRRDHVALFIVRDFRQDGNPKPNHEIIAHGFFSNDALPEGTTRATRARVAEVFGGAAISELW